MSSTRPRRVLYLSYYFPPSGGPGVQRTLKFTRYLPTHGWQPTVVTVRPEDASYPDLDPALAEEVPPSLRVERTRAWDPYALYAGLQGKAKQDTVGVGFVGESTLTWQQRLARWVRANVFLPDARVGWVPFAARRGAAVLRSAPHDALLTTGPPHSTHLAGYLLSRRFGLPWVADFRDPWTGIDYYDALPMTAAARAFDAALEGAVLRTAGTVLVVSPAMGRGLARRVDRPYEVLPNGFDPADFAGEVPTPVADRFELAYVGNMNDARNPEALWQALARVDAPRTMPELRVRLVGNVDPVVQASAERCGVAGCLTTEPYVPHAEAVRVMQRSTALLLVINDVPGAEGILTGKLYEYLAAGRPVLGLGPPDGDAARVLQETGAGRMFAHADASGVGAWLEAQYAAWQAGRPLTGADPDAAARYSRPAQAERLASLLDRTVG